MIFDEVPRRFVPPTGGRAGGRKLTRAVYALEAGLAATDYRTAMAFLRAQVRARSLFVVFTNLLEPRSAKELAASVKGLLPRHLPLCVLLRDTDVEALAMGMRPESSEDRPEDLYVRAAAAESLAWRDALIRGLRNAGRPRPRLAPGRRDAGAREALPRREGATAALMRLGALTGPRTSLLLKAIPTFVVEPMGRVGESAHRWTFNTGRSS